MARNIFIENQNLQENSQIIIDGEEFNHLINVLRYRENDSFVLCNNTGKKYDAIISRINKKNATIIVGVANDDLSAPKVQLDVFQALVKGEKFEIIAQKLTEIGASAIIPFNSEFCQVKGTTTRLDRLEKISIEACKQCGRAKALKVEKIVEFDEILDLLKNYDVVYFAYERATNFLPVQEINDEKIAIVVGSEGGFSESEAQKVTALPNVKVISLGSRILRAETACISLCSNIIFLSSVERG